MPNTEPQVDGRCTPHLTPLHPYKTPFVLRPGYPRFTQSAPLINLGTPSAPPHIRGTEGVLNYQTSIEQERTSEVQFKSKESPFKCCASYVPPIDLGHHCSRNTSIKVDLKKLGVQACKLHRAKLFTFQVWPRSTKTHHIFRDEIKSSGKFANLMKSTTPGFAQPRQSRVKFGGNMKVLRWHSKKELFSKKM